MELRRIYAATLVKPRDNRSEGIRVLPSARSLARRQSKVTHQGDEAAAAAELLSFITYNAINDPSLDPADVKANVLASLNTFVSDEPSVNALAKHESNVPNAQDALKMENWDWTAPNFSFNALRLAENSGYIGSYSLDALAMALHCVYSTHSFEDPVLKAATRGGDADSVGAVVGQIAGAIYGAKNIPKEWRDAVMQWDRDGEIAARGYLLSQIK
jgi:ADP-ribosyl-[dinitrogen reductase] hydrolase